MLKDECSCWVYADFIDNILDYTLAAVGLSTIIDYHLRATYVVCIIYHVWYHQELIHYRESAQEATVCVCFALAIYNWHTQVAKWFSYIVIFIESGQLKHYNNIIVIPGGVMSCNDALNSRNNYVHNMWCTL